MVLNFLLEYWRTLALSSASAYFPRRLYVKIVMVKRYIFWNYLSPRRNSRRDVYHPRKKNLIRRSVSDENIKHFCVSLRINARYSYVYQSVNVIDESLRNDFMEKSHVYKYDISHSERQLVKQRLIVLYENWNCSADPRTTREIVKNLCRVLSSKMRPWMSCLVIALALCTSSFAYGIDGNYTEVHEIDTNTLSQSPAGQLPPQDPAVHSFPTAPLLPICTKEGYFRDPFNCRKFYYCQYADAVPGGFYCQSPLIFNTVTNSCDHPEFVQC